MEQKCRIVTVVVDSYKMLEKIQKRFYFVPTKLFTGKLCQSNPIVGNLFMNQIFNR